MTFTIISIVFWILSLFESLPSAIFLGCRKFCDHRFSGEFLS